jgi:hypothetical protein
MVHDYWMPLLGNGERAASGRLEQLADLGGRLGRAGLVPAASRQLPGWS